MTIGPRSNYEGSGGWADGRLGQAHDLIWEAMKERGYSELSNHAILLLIEELDSLFEKSDKEGQDNARAD